MPANYSGGYRTGVEPWAQCHSYLAGSGFRLRLRQRLPNGKDLYSFDRAYRVEHQLIQLFIFKVLDRPNEHTPTDQGLPFRCLQLGVVPYI